MSNPYKNLPEYCFWNTAMSALAPGHIDPVTRFERIEINEKVATLGSCFAQHISKSLAKQGFNYFVAENPPDGTSAESAVSNNYGVFSARYGNVYTVKQAVQLFDRAFNAFQPKDDVWRRGEKYVDAFRPQISPEGFDSVDELTKSRILHLLCVKKMFLEADWFVFTLGLTEAWRSRIDGAVYPIAPGVNGGIYDDDKYEFINFSAADVTHDLFELIEKICRVNIRARIILTVSPVPLVATYEDRHVLVSTTLSKSVLRVAADEAEKRFSNVIYFPSYEVITSPASSGRYYKDDLRQVTDLGVSHVMRLFKNHFMRDNECVKSKTILSKVLGNESVSVYHKVDIVCDEEIVYESLRTTGFAK
jgi:hypothetical protein